MKARAHAAHDLIHVRAGDTERPRQLLAIDVVGQACEHVAFALGEGENEVLRVDEQRGIGAHRPGGADFSLLELRRCEPRAALPEPGSCAILERDDEVGAWVYRVVEEGAEVVDEEIAGQIGDAVVVEPPGDAEAREGPRRLLEGQRPELPQLGARVWIRPPRAAPR